MQPAFTQSYDNAFNGSALNPGMYKRNYVSSSHVVLLSFIISQPPKAPTEGIFNGVVEGNTEISKLVQLAIGY